MLIETTLRREIHISAAGPSALTAALTIAKSSHFVIVHAHNSDGGSGFYVNFQELENRRRKEDTYPVEGCDRNWSHCQHETTKGLNIAS